VFADLYRGRRVLVTGHTGFKGSWLCAWLLRLGAKVTGYSLDPPTDPNVFTQLNLASHVTHHRGDLLDRARLASVVREAEPEFVFHLAAQAVVRESYATPVETFAVNVQGTVHLLDALRALTRPCAVVCVTSDKCYENRHWNFGYREDDALGGHDPYSASKGAAEIAIASFRRSFFARHPVRIASARAGNVIGGGDWARDRIVPDCVRALQAGQAIQVRNPQATRPWQHVLEPLSGYLWLGALLFRPDLAPGPAEALTGPFNFGPGPEANRTVADLVQEFLGHWPGRWEDRSDPNAPHEAALLQLSIDKARALLRWAPVWTFASAVAQTACWYRETATLSGDPTGLTSRQIAAYESAAAEARLPWTLTWGVPVGLPAHE